MRTGLSLMPQRGFRDAAAPLFAAGEVDAVEWTIDMGFTAPIPAFVTAILAAFAPGGQLYAHGTGYSPLSAGRDDRASAWLAHAKPAMQAYRYAHLTEHFGFCTGGDVTFGAPLPLPLDGAAIAGGVQRLQRLRDAVGVPIGLENLALAFHRDDVYRQAEAFEALLAPVDGLFHLDVHNLWTQAVNFGLDPVVLARRYPLHRVRLVHVSGGTWVDGIRRDTHDGRVPEAVIALFTELAPLLPHVHTVILERIGTAFADESAQAGFRDDFTRLRTVAQGIGEA